MFYYYINQKEHVQYTFVCCVCRNAERLNLDQCAVGFHCGSTHCFLLSPSNLFSLQDSYYFHLNSTPIFPPSLKTLQLLDRLIAVSMAKVTLFFFNLSSYSVVMCTKLGISYLSTGLIKLRIRKTGLVIIQPPS